MASSTPSGSSGRKGISAGQANDKARQRQTAATTVIPVAYDFALWLIRHVEKYPRSFRFSIGDRLVGYSLTVVESLVEASYSAGREKVSLLEVANRKVNSLRILVRMSRDLGLLTVDQLGFAASRLDEIGRMTGGWLKSAGTPHEAS